MTEAGPSNPAGPPGTARAVADGGNGGEGDGGGGGDDGGDAGEDPTPSVEHLARRARAARESAAPPADPPDDSAALAAARDGLGPVVARYIAARTGERERLSARQLDLLHRATNDWLAVYALAHGVEGDPDTTVRTAAELVVDTHDVAAAARLLTGVPDD